MNSPARSVVLGWRLRCLMADGRELWLDLGDVDHLLGGRLHGGARDMRAVTEQIATRLDASVEAFFDGRLLVTGNRPEETAGA